MPQLAAFLYYSLFSIISYLFSKGEHDNEPRQHHFDEIPEVCSANREVLSVSQCGKPICVSEYKVTRNLPEVPEKQLPSVEDIQKRMERSVQRSDAPAKVSKFLFRTD